MGGVGGIQRWVSVQALSPSNGRQYDPTSYDA